MATVELLFDASIFRYPECRGGLHHLAEETTFSSFIPAFEALNDNIKLTWYQLRECWFYALDQEYEKVLSNAPNMTQYQLENVGELYFRGRSQTESLQRLSQGEWEAAEYNPGQKMKGRDLKGPTKYQKVRHHRKPQDYDPLLLLQSTSEISLHAKRFYEEGVAKFLRKTKGVYDSVMVEQYKLRCVSMAQDHVKQLLKINYSAEKEARAGQSDEHDVKALEDQPKSRRWERRPEWASVWTQMKAERKRIVSELEVGLLVNQSLGHHAMIRNDDKRLLRSLKPEKKHHSTNAAEVSGATTRSMKTHGFKNSVTEIENGVKNLLRTEYTREESPQAQQLQLVELEGTETIRPTQDQIFARMKRARRERKEHTRREEMEKRITTGRDKESHPVSILSNKESISNTTTDDSTRYSLVAHQQREHVKFGRSRGTRRQKSVSWADGEPIPCGSHERGNAHGNSVSALSGLPSHSLQRDKETTNTETHDELQTEERDGMDVEVTERIAKLEM